MSENKISENEMSEKEISENEMSENEISEKRMSENDMINYMGGRKLNESRGLL